MESSSVEEKITDSTTENNNEECYIIEAQDEIVCLSSDSNDVVVVNKRRTENNKNKEINNESVMISSDTGSSDTFDDIDINIQSDESDGQVSDVDVGISVKWNKVPSPKGWTKAMKRYYNKSCKRQRYFDWRKVLQEIRLESSSDWSILTSDLYPSPVRRRRCLICRQTDHLSKNCPRKIATCTMCGDKGHLYFKCPKTMCLNCGSRKKDFIDYCGECYSDNKIKCSGCKKYGHESKNCPDLWRRFHRTVAFKEIDVTAPELNNNIQCCNCAKTGHLFEECTESYWSSYTPTSFLVTNYDDYTSRNQNDSHSKSSHFLPRSNNVKHLRRGRYDSSDDEDVLLRKQLKLHRHHQPNECSNNSKFWKAITDSLSVFQRKKKRSKKKKKKKTSSKEYHSLPHAEAQS